MSDRKIAAVNVGGTTIDHFSSEILTANDYYAFGFEIKGRKVNSGSSYLYGFNGKRKDNEITVDGGDYDFGARIYDSRLGRWLALDPLADKYPNVSPYIFVANNPIFWIDGDGKKLILGGDREKALADVRSLVPERFQSAIQMTDAGEVYIDNEIFTSSGIGYTGEFASTEGAAGANLISDLIGASETYLYETGDANGNYSYTDRITGKKGVANITRDGNGISNLSKQPYIIMNPKKPEELSALDNMQPTEGFDSQVVVDAKAKWNEGKGEPNDKGEYPEDNSPKPRSSIVFHELKEAYERTTKKLPYKYINYLRGEPDTRGATFEPGGYKESTAKFNQGAHGKAEDAEKNAGKHGADPIKSKYPGVGAKVK